MSLAKKNVFAPVVANADAFELSSPMPVRQARLEQVQRILDPRPELPKRADEAAVVDYYRPSR